MVKLRSIWANLQQRRKFLALTSGALIAIALGADYFLGWRSIYNIAMVAAAVIAGYDIAARALASLRNRHFSIELLVTIAALGASIAALTVHTLANRRETRPPVIKPQVSAD